MNSTNEAAIRAAVTAALRTLTSAELHELTMEPYRQHEAHQAPIAA